MADSQTKRERAILYLLSSPTVEVAAEQAGISTRTLRRWSRQERFSADLEAARKSVFRHSLLRLAALTTKALEVVEAILDDDDATDRDKLRAAALVLNHAQASELSDTLRQLEQQISQMETST
jgi:DNA-binding transcriptional MerR regulator